MAFSLMSGESWHRSSGMPEHATNRVRHLHAGKPPGFVGCLLDPGGSAAAPRHRAYPGPVQTNARQTRALARTCGVTYVVGGTAVLRLGRRALVLRAGDCVRFDGLEPGSWRLDKGPGYAECAVYVDGVTGGRLRELGLWEGTWVRAHIGLLPPVVSAYCELQGVLGDPAVSPGSVLRRFLDLVERLRGLAAESTPGERFRREAVRLLAADVSPAAGIGPVARRLGLSPAQFRRRFRAATGESPVGFRLRLRLERAAELLGRHSVKEVASALGYPDPFALSRQFSARFGLPPSHVRAGR